MPSRSRLVSLPVLVIAVVALVAGCGGGGGAGDKDATQLLQTAFKQPIKSANVNFNLGVQVKGVPALSAPISVKAAGPYSSNGPGKLPSLALNISIAGGGQSVPIGLTSTGDNFFVTLRGTTYELGKAAVARVNQQLAKQRGSGPTTSLSALGIHPSTWLSGATNEGDTTLAGTKVTHVSAGLNVGKVLDDLNQLVKRAPTSSVTGAAPPQLTDKQKSEIEHAVKSPHIDVYVAKSDHTIRRLAGTIEITIPKNEQSKFGGATGATLQLSIEFSQVGQPQHITAPPNAKPISELTRQLNSLTGSLGGGSSSSGSSGSSGSGSGSSPSAKQFDQYAKCIQKAGGANPAALNKCAKLLQ